MAIPSRLPSLEHRDFRNFVVGSFISNIGNQMQGAAIAYQLLHLTGANRAVGLMGLVRVVPFLCLGLFGGYLADQFDRRSIILWSQIALSLIAVALAYVTMSGHATLPALYTIVGITAATSSFAGPARQSLVPNLVPLRDFPNAASVNGIQWRLSEVLGPTIAGVAIGFAPKLGMDGLTLCYGANAVSYIAMIVAVYRIPKKIVDRGGRSNSPVEVIRMIGEGFRFVKSAEVLRNAMFIDFWATLLAGASALIPGYASQVMHVGPTGYGILAAAGGVGALVASIALASTKTIHRQGWWVITMIAIYGIATVLFGLAPVFWMAVFFLALTGAADMVSTVLRQTIRQIATPDEMRGRMSAISMLFHMTGPQLGDAEAGFLADWTSVRTSIVVGGIGSMGVSAWYWLRDTALRHYVHESDGEEPR